MDVWTMYLTGASNAATRAVAKTRSDLGLLVTPDTKNLLAHIPDYPAWAADNACFAHAGAFDTDKFMAFLDAALAVPGAKEKCLFAVAPDVFDAKAMRGDPAATIARSLPILPMIRAKGVPAALVAQDGLEDMLEAIPWDAFDVLFVGGGDDFKLGRPSDPELGGELAEDCLFPDETYGRAFKWLLLMREAHCRGKKIHVGRVNSWTRVLFANCWGAASVDGTYIKFGPAKNLPKLVGWLDKLAALEPEPEEAKEVA
jgi:hypothetical protein